MLIPNKEELNCPGKLGNLYIEKNYNEFYNHLLNIYKDYNYSKFSELLYCYYNNITIHPTCPVCGKEVPFLTFNKGYQTCCSIKCASNYNEFVEKRINTMIQKYGTPHPCQNSNIKKKLINTYTTNHGGMGNASEKVKEKHINTMIQKYGTSHALCNEDVKLKMLNTNKELYGGVGAGSTIIKEKINNTNKIKFGGEPLSNKCIREKIRKTNIEKYGVDIPTSNKIIKNKVIETKKNKIISNNTNIINIYNDNGETYYTCKCPHIECNRCLNKYFSIPSSRYYNRIKDNTEICTNLLPIQKYHGKGTTLELFIQSILNEYNIDYMCNDRTILNGKELDIYIPSKKIAIECNGIYWHSRENKPILYHINKYKECYDKGIQLITVWEDWVINYKNIIKSLLINKLGLCDITIYARKCEVRELDTKTTNNFLNQNHIQQKTYASIKLGLYYKDELVSVMTFGKKKGCLGNRYNITNEYELSRFCNKLNIRVVGGASKLLKYFIDNYNPSSIYSFSSNDISNGNLYKQLGFETDYKINQSYWYIDMQNMKRYHRTTFTKDRIIKLGLASDDKNWKEIEVMRNNKFFQIYDSGQLKWILNIKKGTD